MEVPLGFATLGGRLVPRIDEASAFPQGIGPERLEPEGCLARRA